MGNCRKALHADGLDSSMCANTMEELEPDMPDSAAQVFNSM